MSANEFEREVLKGLGRIEQKVDDLSGPQGRVTHMENAQTRQWWYTFSVVPLIEIGREILRHFGVRV